MNLSNTNTEFGVQNSHSTSNLRLHGNFLDPFQPLKRAYDQCAADVVLCLSCCYCRFVPLMKGWFLCITLYSAASSPLPSKISVDLTRFQLSAVSCLITNTLVPLNACATNAHTHTMIERRNKKRIHKHMHIYVGQEREREREGDTHTHTCSYLNLKTLPSRTHWQFPQTNCKLF